MREPVGLPTLVAWRRTGLVACSAALLALVAAVILLAGWREDAGTVGGLLFGAAFLGALVGLGFLQRAWSDPEVADDPTVVRARRWAAVATVTWCLSWLPGLAARAQPDSLGWFRWLVLVLAGVAVVAFAGMLVSAARWRPGR